MKRQQSDFELYDVERKKNQRTTVDTRRLLFTRFEDLSNELIYAIFELLDGYDLFEIFSNLNSRFQNLLTHPTLCINMNLSSISESTFQRCHTYTIMPNKHRIKSLHLSDPFAADLIFLPPRSIPKFGRLKTLILDDIKSKYLDHLLHFLTLLPCLSSLILSPADCFRNKMILYPRIFLLPVLKYCKLSYQAGHRSMLLPLTTNQCSTVEHLIIDCYFESTEIAVLLFYTPRLRHLSCRKLAYIAYQEMEMPIISNNLTQASFDFFEHFNFDQFEPRQSYTLCSHPEEKIRPHRQQTTFDTVRHVYIDEEQSVSNCLFRFPKCTELTLLKSLCQNRDSTITSLHRIIPLMQLIRLTIRCLDLFFGTIIEVLHSAPNIQILDVDFEYLFKLNPISAEQTEKLRLVSNENKIQRLTISRDCTAKVAEVFVNLCPRVQRIDMNISIKEFESTMRVLLMKHNINSQHLC
ncbi:unnamed protein product [Rotaria magnacalcarata]|uniref:F-box domain-containing protein n=1 Tax=Rotaria magnacalcarata TaxID=392030 RepID=A0A816RUM4_9BILA|nr:unnamed protein product [Rotaria magnacalcarata]